MFYFLAEKMEFRNIKKIESQNTALFIALVPDEVDLNGDKISAEEIKKAAYEFMKNLQDKAVNIDHEEKTNIETAHFVESYLTLVDMERNGDTIPQWTWIVGIQFDEDTFEKVQEGDFIWISIEWKGQYT